MNAQKYIPLVARTFLAVIFIQTGIGKIAGFAGVQERIASVGIPLAALIAVFAIVFELVGGCSLILGYKARIGAVLLLVFLMPTTLIFHNPIADSTQMIQFMKNLAIIGGLLMVTAYGSGPISLDNKTAAAATILHSEDQ